MSELGNIFEGLDEAEASNASKTRGPDLVTEVVVQRKDLGAPEGQRVDVPRTLPGPEGPVARAESPHDEGDLIVLHLPDDFPEGGALKLRRQGGVSPDGGPPGDLIVRVSLRGPAGPRRQADATLDAPLARRGDGALAVGPRDWVAWAPWIAALALGAGAALWLL